MARRTLSASDELLAVAIAGIFGIWNDNHAVSTYHDDIFTLPRAYTAVALYNGWLKKMDDEYGKVTPHPMFIVASTGEGIKAYENSCVATALQFVDAIRSRIARDAAKRRVIPVFIQIDNDYIAKLSQPLKVFPELRAPIETLLNARAHADSVISLVPFSRN